MSDLLPQNDVTSTPHKDFFEASAEDFIQIPGAPIAYTLSSSVLHIFKVSKTLRRYAIPRQGLASADNDRFLREWFEVSNNHTNFTPTDAQTALQSACKWFPTQKGGGFRRWYGNHEFIINWNRNGYEIRHYRDVAGRLKSRPQNLEYLFRPGLTWTAVTTGDISVRLSPAGFISNAKGPELFPEEIQEKKLLGIINSSSAQRLLTLLAPTLDYSQGPVGSLPIPSEIPNLDTLIDEMVSTAQSDWDSYETSWDFKTQPILKILKNDSGKKLSGDAERQSLEGMVNSFINSCEITANRQQQREILNNELVADAYGIHDEVPSDVPIERVSLKSNPAFIYPKNTPTERNKLFARDIIKEIISYAVGCMFGRYSLDKPGLILASQGETLEDYHAQIPNPSFEPDKDNVIPVTEVDCFEDDIVSRFRRFLEVTLGKENLTANIAYIQSVLGKDLRKYFVNDFYNDHVKMYKNRPIYWQYSSRTDNKGSFKVLVYLHRYMPKTNSTVLGYLRDYTSRITGIVEQLEKSDRTQDKRASEKLHKAIVECKAYEDQTLYPLATRNLEIDLDDGVLVNYLRLGKALREIPAIERKRKEVESWTWPHYPLKQ